MDDPLSMTHRFILSFFAFSFIDSPINFLVPLFVHSVGLFVIFFLPHGNRSHGHTQKLEDSDMTSSRVPPPIERCQKNKPHSVHHHSKTQPNGSSLSISSNSSSSSSKLQSNLEGIAGGELLWQEEGCTSSGVSTADAADPSKSTDFEQHSSVQKNFVCISNRARHSFIDGILFTKQLAKEPALGNLIDFDNDGLNN